MAAAGAGGGEGMLVREKAAKELVHQSFQAETMDREDHTFSGVMFDVRTRNLPFEYLEVQSVWVRGDLGPMTVWVTDETYHGKHECIGLWEKIYCHTHAPSPAQLCQFRLNRPIRMAPDDSKGFYIHSAMVGDEGIVYDNQRSKYSHRDLYMDITAGMAHLSNVPFSPDHQFEGWWGSPWRVRREFVGRIGYGVKWLLWNPEINHQMPPLLRKMAWVIMMSRHPKASKSPLHILENEMIFYILNKVQWWENPAIMEDLIEHRLDGEINQKRAKSVVKRSQHGGEGEGKESKRSKRSKRAKH